MRVKVYTSKGHRKRFQQGCGDAPHDAFGRARCRALRAPAASALRRGTVHIIQEDELTKLAQHRLPRRRGPRTGRLAEGPVAFVWSPDGRFPIYNILIPETGWPRARGGNSCFQATIGAGQRRFREPALDQGQCWQVETLPHAHEHQTQTQSAWISFGSGRVAGREHWASLPLAVSNLEVNPKTRVCASRARGTPVRPRICRKYAGVVVR
jgi:hypothetical protein